MAGGSWLAEQIWLFCAALCGGFLLGAAYHLFREAGAGKRRLSRAATARRDALFAAASGLALICFWFTVTDGSLYASDFLWLAGGFILYRKTLMTRLQRISVRLPHPHLLRHRESKKPSPPRGDNTIQRFTRAALRPLAVRRFCAKKNSSHDEIM